MKKTILGFAILISDFIGFSGCVLASTHTAERSRICGAMNADE